MASNNECRIRKAKKEDQTAIESIATEAFAIYVPRMDRKPFPMLDDYGRHIADGHAHVLEEDGKIRGYIILLPGKENLLLDNIAVSPTLQGAGYGAVLLKFAEEYAKAEGFERITVYTNEAMRENVPFYQHFGYEISHRITENGYRRIYFIKYLLHGCKMAINKSPG